MSLRRTALARRTELRRRTPMPRGRRQLAARATRTMRGQRSTGPTVTQRHLVAERAGHCCEVCGLALHNGTGWTKVHSFHHRQPRGAGGTRRVDVNSPTNILLVCGTGTTGCHGRIESRRTEAYAAGWLVRSGNSPAEISLAVWWTTAKVLLAEDGSYMEATA